MSRPQRPNRAIVTPVVEPGKENAAQGRSADRATATEWCQRKGIVIPIRGGWNTTTPEAEKADWGRVITEAEFDRRAKKSVVVPVGNLRRQDARSGEAA